MKYAIIAFYHFCHIQDPYAEVARWKRDLQAIGARGRIYLSFEGVNSQMSLPEDKLEDFEEWIRSNPLFQDAEVKIHQWHEHTFEKLIIKFRQQLVAFDTPVDLSRRGTHVEPGEWKSMLENRDQNTVLLDVRNQYEYDIGHFEGAIAPQYNTFRDYRKFAEEFCSTHDPKQTKVMMCCTGGIRCEIFSSYLVEKGFENVYQLHGGIIQYGLEVGSEHWKGKLFVFDDRMAVPISKQQTAAISKCRFCNSTNDDLYNCANTDCNEMFTCCPQCLKQYLGCCSSACSNSQRLRPLKDQNPHKPFRKWHLYKDQNQSANSCSCS